MTCSRPWRLTRLPMLSLLLGSTHVSAQSESITSSASSAAASSAAASSNASSTTSAPLTHTVNVAQVGFSGPPASNASFCASIANERRLGRLHIRSRCHISRSRRLHPYVFADGQALLSLLLTIHIQNSISFPQTTALFAQNTNFLAYPMKTLA